MKSKCQGDAEIMAGSETTDSSFHDAILTRHACSDFKTVKKNKLSRMVKSDLTSIDTYNMFEVFNNPELFPVTTDEDPERPCKKRLKEVKNVTGNKYKRKVRCSEAKIPFYNKFEDKSRKDQVIKKYGLNNRSNAECMIKSNSLGDLNVKILS